MVTNDECDIFSGRDHISDAAFGTIESYASIRRGGRQFISFQSPLIVFSEIHITYIAARDSFNGYVLVSVRLLEIIQINK
jgi:hypothetical protein